MSTGSKETKKHVPSVEDFEKAKKEFNSTYSQEEFLALAKLYSESFRDVKEGELVKGKIVRIQGDLVILDVGLNPKAQFQN